MYLTNENLLNNSIPYSCKRMKLYITMREREKKRVLFDMAVAGMLNTKLHQIIRFALSILWWRYALESVLVQELLRLTIITSCFSCNFWHAIELHLKCVWHFKWHRKMSIVVFFLCNPIWMLPRRNWILYI